MAVLPGPLRRRAEGVVEMIGALDRGLVQPAILAAGDPVVGDAHLEEVAHHVELVPADVAEVRMAVDRVERMDVAVGQLGREDDRDPLLDLRAEGRLRLGQFGIAFRIDGQRQADRLHRVVDVGVAPGRAGVLPVRLAAEHLGGVDQVQQFLSGAAGFHLPDAVRQPFFGQPLDLLLPEPAEFDLLELDGLQGLLLRTAGNRGEAEVGNGGGENQAGGFHEGDSCAVDWDTSVNANLDDPAGNRRQREP